MATISTINIGNIVNDGLGDDLRTAFQKVNANFATLNNDLTITASNLGNTGEGIFNSKNGTDLQFKRIIAGNKIVLSSSAESITISSTVQNSFTRFTTNNGFVDSNDYQLVTIQGDPDVSVTADTGVITVSTKLDLHQILEVLDFGPCNGAYENIMQINTAASNIDFGTFENPGRLSYDLGDNWGN
jgi:hypothetical protein